MVGAPICCQEKVNSNCRQGYTDQAFSYPDTNLDTTTLGIYCCQIQICDCTHIHCTVWNHCEPQPENSGQYLVTLKSDFKTAEVRVKIEIISK